jgi:hypothetical protein
MADAPTSLVVELDDVAVLAAIIEHDVGSTVFAAFDVTEAKYVPSFAALHDVGAMAAANRVVAETAPKMIPAVAADEFVRARSPIDGILAAEPPEAVSPMRTPNLIAVL